MRIKAEQFIKFLGLDDLYAQTHAYSFSMWGVGLKGGAELGLVAWDLGYMEATLSVKYLGVCGSDWTLPEEPPPWPGEAGARDEPHHFHALYGTGSLGLGLGLGADLTMAEIDADDNTLYASPGWTTDTFVGSKFAMVEVEASGSAAFGIKAGVSRAPVEAFVFWTGPATSPNIAVGIGHMLPSQIDLSVLRTQLGVETGIGIGGGISGGVGVKFGIVAGLADRTGAAAEQPPTEDPTEARTATLTLLFELNKTDPRTLNDINELSSTLAEWRVWLECGAVKMTIVGEADPVGSEQRNLELSWSRALATSSLVRDLLTSALPDGHASTALAIPLDQVRVFGVGELPSRLQGHDADHVDPTRRRVVVTLSLATGGAA